MNLFWLAPLGSCLALGFVVYLIFGVILPKDPGTDKMQEIARYVSEGAYTYLKRQYSIVGDIFRGSLLYAFVDGSSGLSGYFVPFAF